MTLRPAQRPASRLGTARLALLAAVLLPLTPTAAVAADGSPSPTTPAATTPAATTPVATTPEPTAPPTTPTATPAPAPAPSPSLGAAATAADISWTPPPSITEETKFSLRLDGALNGQATAHIALLRDVSACPSSPLYPAQTAAGTRLTVKPVAAGAEPARPGLGGTTGLTMSLTPKDSGSYVLCGWVVGSPAFGEASTVARFAQPVAVANRPATLTAEIPGAVRSGDYFTVKLTGTAAASGRRVLIMAEKNLDRRCQDLRKAPNGKLPLQTVVAVPSGAFSKTLRLRYRSRTAGTYKLCTQVVETVDRTPEAIAETTMQVGEGLKCVGTQTALAQRSADLGVIRKRRDAALTRLNTAKTRVAPARRRLSSVRRSSDKRIATARKAASRAKSKAGRAKAKRRLTQVRRTEARRVHRAGAPLRKAEASVKVAGRTYRQYRTGARLLDETIGRTKKDLRKYCAAS